MPDDFLHDSPTCSVPPHIELSYSDESVNEAEHYDTIDRPAVTQQTDEQQPVAAVVMQANE